MRRGFLPGRRLSPDSLDLPVLASHLSGAASLARMTGPSSGVRARVSESRGRWFETNGPRGSVRPFHPNFEAETLPFADCDGARLAPHPLNPNGLGRIVSAATD